MLVERTWGRQGAGSQVPAAEPVHEGDGDHGEEHVEHADDAEAPEGFAGAEPDRAAYIASKAVVLGLTRALAREYGREGFRVNALVPGGIKTPGTLSVAKRVASEMHCTDMRAEVLPAQKLELVDELKRRVPIWKKEFFEGGEVWIEGPGEDSGAEPI